MCAPPNVEPDETDMFTRLNPNQLLKYLTAEEIGRVMTACRVENCASGDILIRSGDRNRDLIVVERGAVEVIITLRDGREITVAELHDNALIGEMNFVLPMRRTATIRAGADTVVQRFEYSRLTDLLRTEPGIAAKLFAAINDSQAETFIRTLERLLKSEG
jgi:CRP-like cAMP-binding protein